MEVDFEFFNLEDPALGPKNGFLTISGPKMGLKS